MRYAVILVGCCACSFHPNSSSSTIDAPAVTPDAVQIIHDAPHLSPDAAIDAPPDAPKTWVSVETVTVPCSGAGSTSVTVLASGVTYQLRASGECIANTANGSRADAEYIAYNFGSPVDTYSNIDEGLAVDDATLDATKQPRWGAYDASHTYLVNWTGAGATITGYYHDADTSNNSGSLSLEILAYQ